MSIRAADVAIFRRHDSAEGLSAPSVARAIDSGELRRIRPGVFARADEVLPLSRAEKSIVRSRALDAASRYAPVFSHLSAAALHGLPLWDVDREDAVHVIAPPERPGATAGTVRHRGELRDEDIVEIAGLLCTSLDRTVADVTRTAARTTAACIADAALRVVAFDGPGRYRHDDADEFRDRVATQARRSVHGVGRSRAAMDFADGRAQLPGESISRLLLRDIGFDEVQLQVRVAAPGGGDYWVDFGLEDADAFGEFDGRGKYRDVLLRRGLSIEEVLDREKQREDWIRGTTQRRMARWSIEHCRSARHLGDRLAAFGIIPAHGSTARSTRRR